MLLLKEHAESVLHIQLSIQKKSIQDPIILSTKDNPSDLCPSYSYNYAWLYTSRIITIGQYFESLLHFLLKFHEEGWANVHVHSLQTNQTNVADNFNIYALP